MRFVILDGFRGFFLLFMMIAHANAVLNAPIGRYNHHYIGWVEDAQGFVFISGLVVAMVYGKILLRKGRQAMAEGIGGRIRKIYAYHAALILTFLVAALLLPMAGIRADILGQQQDEPFVFTLASLMLTTGTLHMGILPMYLFFMLATPGVLWLFHTGRAPVVLAGSVLLWLFAQTGLPDLAQLPVEAGLDAAGHPINIGIYFNIFGWQALFCAGLWIGWLSASRRLDLGVLRRPELRPMVWLALGAFLLLLVLDVIAYKGYLPQHWRQLILAPIDRGNFHIVYVIAFAVDLFLVTWLIVAGPGSGNRGFALAGTALNWLFTRPALIALGKHSLQIFAAHILMVYALSIWAGETDVDAISPMTRNLLLLASLAPLWGVAWLHERVKLRRAATAAAAA
ncbi:OpgC family protein [Frigidibacter oleivorans]|uniref:OpgC family protein n=1 Tax=Frigidibacter oleivorans TaxID=2487129 RepID=UPI0013DEF44F|nr:OpgC domain-containing protein [Frigidibacter oleivorans]